MLEIIFPAGRIAALNRLKAIQPSEYSRSRNFLDGAVTKLSGYISHGLLSITEIKKYLDQHPERDHALKLYQELGWRCFFHQVWDWYGEKIKSNLENSKVIGISYTQNLPDDIAIGQTNNSAINRIVLKLLSRGYLHNHERLWLASYIIHWRQIDWLTGANWMFANLIDGDQASNHLSWQWVASTFSSKPYFFNLDNIKRYGEELLDYSQPAGFVADFDLAYARLEQKLFPNGFEDKKQVSEPLKQKLSQSWLKNAPENSQAVYLVTPWSLGRQHYPDAANNFIFIQTETYSPLRQKFIDETLKLDFPGIKKSTPEKLTEDIKTFNSKEILAYGYYAADWLDLAKKHLVTLYAIPGDQSFTSPVMRFHQYWKNLTTIWDIKFDERNWHK